MPLRRAEDAFNPDEELRVLVPGLSICRPEASHDIESALGELAPTLNAPDELKDPASVRIDDLRRAVTVLAPGWGRRCTEQRFPVRAPNR